MQTWENQKTGFKRKRPFLKSPLTTMSSLIYIPANPQVARLLEECDDHNPQTGVARSLGTIHTLNHGPIDVYTVDTGSSGYSEFKPSFAKAFALFQEVKIKAPLKADLASGLGILENPEEVTFTLAVDENGAEDLQRIFGDLLVQEATGMDLKIYRLSFSAKNLDASRLGVLKKFHKFISHVSCDPEEIISQFNTTYLNLFLFADRALKTQPRHADNKAAQRPWKSSGRRTKKIWQSVYGTNWKPSDVRPTWPPGRPWQIKLGRV